MRAWILHVSMCLVLFWCSYSKFIMYSETSLVCCGILWRVSMALAIIRQETHKHFWSCTMMYLAIGLTCGGVKQYSEPTKHHNVWLMSGTILFAVFYECATAPHVQWEMCERGREMCVCEVGCWGEMREKSCKQIKRVSTYPPSAITVCVPIITCKISQ